MSGFLCEADDLVELISGNEERKMGIREWRGSPRERWKWCHQDLCMPSHPFHPQLRLNILCSSTQLINIIFLYSLCHSWQKTPHKIPISTWRRSKFKKGLIDYLAVIRLKELRCRQQNTTSSSYHCCSREACQTSWNLIDAGKPALLASPCSDVPVHLLPFAS